MTTPLSASLAIGLAALVLAAGAVVPSREDQPGGATPPPYLVEQDGLDAIAQRYGLDDDARERLERAHHHLVEHQSKPKPDPIEANGPVFKDWPRPDAVLLFTGEQIGYLEPCGCAGLENQKGGLKRRHTLVRTLRESMNWPVALFDVGEQVRYFGPQADIKHRHTTEALIELGYDAVGFGVKDLRTDLVGLAINLDEDTNPFTSANVGILDFDSGFTKRWREVTVGDGVRIGVTQVLGPKVMKEVAPDGDLIVVPPEEALAEVVPELEAARCDQNVLLVYGDPEDGRALARQFDVFDWVVVARDADEPRHALDETNRIEGTTRGGGAVLIEVGHKGMYAVAIGLYRQAGGQAPGDGWEARYQPVPLDHRWADSPAMHERVVRYQDELESLEWKGLGLKPEPHPTERDFIGSAVCADCHMAAWEAFVKTPHFHTTETLLALQPARHLDPECIACHATGWEPQKYHPFKTGWLSYSETPQMHGQGCENCHGPAARHAMVELGDLEVPEAEQEKLRAALHMEIQPNEGNMPGQVLNETTRAVNNCLTCHDQDNSPDFDFQKYWLEVAHEGVD